MDDFLKEIYTLLFKKWILLQKNNQYSLSIDTKHNNIIIIETKKAIGKITFNPYSIIEMSIFNKQINDDDFYLHFQMTTLAHAIELFYELIKTLNQYTDRINTKILLCCSGGLTTSYFAEKLNNAFQILNLAIDVEASSYNHIYTSGQDYDIILLAPQISYHYNEVKNNFKSKPILKIPPQVFGKYDVGKLMYIIHQELKKWN